MIRIRLAYSHGQWTLAGSVKVARMTLPRPDELPKVHGNQALIGFWTEAVDRHGKVLHRTILQDPVNLGVELFDPNGVITRTPRPRRDVTIEVLVPDVAELEAIHIYQSRGAAAGQRHAPGTPRIIQLPRGKA